MTKKNSIRGKKAKKAGQRFEIKVRKDLEDKGWVVDKWSNNVELIYPSFLIEKDENLNKPVEGKLVPAKYKFRGKGIPMMLSAGFPDFITFRTSVNVRKDKYYYEVIGVEVKSNGYLTKEEKEKCSWLLDNHIFSKILIASKGKKRGEIVYKEFK